MNGFSSKAIHGAVSKKDQHGSLRYPLYNTAAFEAATAHDLELAFEGKKPLHTYSRITNPTVEDFEQRIRLLTDAFGVIAVSSGMAAITETILTLAETGSNIITSPFLFGNTSSLFGKTLKRWGLEVQYANMTDPQTIENLINDNTRMIFLEVITNPQLEIADITKVSEIAHKHAIPVVLDGTLTTPFLFKSKDFGVAVEIISSTKYISGGATSIGGLIIDNGVFSWKNNKNLADEAMKSGPGAFIVRLRREVHRNCGSCVSPHTAWLQTLGLETLALRVDKSSANALSVAEYLNLNKKVHNVSYPGLKESLYHKTARQQFKGRYGGILTFELDSKSVCFNFMDNLSMIRRATNINDNKTLIIHPASTIFCDYLESDREKMKVYDRMIRLSVGIEDSEDIIADLQRGLDSI